MYQHARFLVSLALGVFLATACSERESGNTVVSSQHTQVFHAPSCEWAQKISKSNKRTFHNAREAMDAGLGPCKVCRSQISGPVDSTGELPADEKEEATSNGNPEPPIKSFESLN